MKIIMATNNPGKIEELKKMIPACYEVLSQAEAGITGIDVEENGETFEQNAILKVNALSMHVKEDVLIIGEDTGISIDALNGYPGTKTKRAAVEEVGHDLTDEERNNYTISKMAGVSDRTVHWETDIALLESDDESIHIFKGVINGTIAHEAAGSNGFGFDPIFYIPAEGKTLAQMSFEEKAKYSARAEAVKQLVSYLERRALHK